RFRLVEAGAHELETQLGRRVDQDARAPVRLDDRPDARALVTRVRRPAHIAVAAQLGDAEARAGAQERQLHTVSTFSVLVEPGTSKGTPAVTITLSPLLASLRRVTASSAIRTISSYALGCGTRSG